MSTKNIETTGNGQDAMLSSAAVARRRILLKGLGKGAAVLAATAPIQTLASQSLLTFDGLHQCTVSGMKSGVHSKTPLDTTPRCGGFSIAHWSNLNTTQWPGGTVTSALKWKDVFTTSSSYKNNTLAQILQNSSSNSSTEAHWIVAWLNATQPPPGTPFPYTRDEVVAYNTAASVDAYTFFTTFMEKTP